MISVLIIIISFLLDGILTNFLPYMVNDLSYFTPLFTVVSIFLIYPFYQKKEKKYYITVLLLGIFYDLFYTNLLFFNAMLFLMIAFTTKYIYKNLQIGYLKLLFYIISIICLYEITTAFFIVIFNLVPMTFPRLLYKISHSILLNIVYAELIYLIIQKIPQKYKEISIN